ncbi:chromosome segregation protein SMC [Aliidiomarina quisquiliarum]|uniref:chromosome segregation protein SMC n=1 Tax=Aliidiomarina quisquiliarum TaxID=2938947 RepID=UPI00208EC868|nr:chromosome segregation protein SMC [Aliidiomarina quisquiliarum]MCO4320099.1 chromosome segregation protein SMC [Aliidiomarina quisquiliarum]
MRLKYIRLVGFKSFVDSTKVAFPEQMTCIVGPNGCGKSNVIDAVRWVLGESSAKNLRGDAMTDVIFNGSTARKPVSQASVELVFDNQERRLQGEFADYNEVSVKRLVTREGQSVYFLNGTKCRRRDITDLFLGTGLGPRSYAIIEQGMISRLIESRPQELRVFIEEAAGISKYKERRKETASRMARTRDNLDRLTDVRDELGQQLAKLQRQAAAAKRYQALKADERRLKSELQALRWLHYQQQCDRIEQELQGQENELEKWLAEQRGSERGQTELRQQEHNFQDLVASTQAAFYQHSTQVTSLEQQIRHQRQLNQQRQQQQAALAQNLVRIAEELASEEHRVLDYEAEREQLAATLLELEEQAMLEAEQRQELELNLQQWQDEWQELRDHSAQLTERSSVLQAEQRAAQQLHEQLQQRQQHIHQELAELQAVDSNVVQQYQAELAVHQQQLAEHQQQGGELQRQQDQLQAAKLSATQQRSDLQSLLHKTEGQLSSVKHLLAAQAPRSSGEFSHWLLSQQNLGSLRELLTVPTKWLAATETLLHGWLAAPVLASTPAQWPQGADRAVLALRENIQWPAQSLAAQLAGVGNTVSLFDGVAVAENDTQARQLLLQPQWHAVALADGRIIGDGWVLGRPEDADSQLSWQQDIHRLTAQLAQLNEQFNAVEVEIAQHEQKQQLVKLKFEQVNQQAQESERNLVRTQERLLSAERELNAQQARLAALNTELKHITTRTLDLERQSEQRKAELQAITLEVDAVGPRLISAEQQGNNLRAQVRQAQQQAQHSQQQVHGLQLNVQQVESKLQHLAQQIQRLAQQQQDSQEQMHADAQHAADADEIIVLEEQLAEALLSRELVEQELREAKEQLSAVQQQLSIINQGQSAVLEQIAKQRERVEASRLELAASRERGNALLESFNELKVSLKNVLSAMPEDAEEKRWQRELDDCLRKVSQLGAINLAAIDEVEAQLERKEYLDAQYEDLQASLDILDGAIKKIDRETRARFKQTFEQVNSGLQSLFPKVFSGGTAYLELTDDDLLETGVTIMARPPGKKNSTIHLLSGGEKALTALALVFAIFKLNPAPFCLLDEVDAPLDDINVGRFCRLVQEMSESVQFIYISHNKIAMEMATHLIGVTMQEPGVSRLVAVDVDEALAIAEAS